jgi:hypothetical protein
LWCPPPDKAREQFALFLESPGPGERAVRVVRQHGHAAVTVARNAFSGLIAIGKSTAIDVQRLLGAPDDSDGTTLAYSIASRPGYRYAFDFDATRGLLVWSGYRRAGAEPAAITRRTQPDNNVEFVAQLATVGATMDEVRAWLGEPAFSAQMRLNGSPDLAKRVDCTAKHRPSRLQNAAQKRRTEHAKRLHIGSCSMMA